MTRSPFPGLAAPAAGFEQPLEMLEACHERVARQCDTLERLAAHLAGHGADDDARSAAAGVLRYFDSAACDHHADEETDLFPALLEAVAGADAVCLRALAAALAADHRALEAQWRALRAGLLRVAAGEGVRLDRVAVAAFTARYADHVAREEAELLPLARRLLGAAELERIGRAMRMRRGVAGP